MCESKQGVKGNIYFCKIFHCRTCSAGQQCDCTVSRANGSGSSKYSRMLFLARTRFHCSASPADATSALALDKHCLHFYAGNRRERDLKKKKNEVFLDLHFSSSFLKSLRVFIYFFTIIIPSQHSMITVRDAWRARVVTVFGVEQTPCVSMFACSDREARHLPNSTLLRSEEENVIVVLLSRTPQTASLLVLPVTSDLLLFFHSSHQPV